MIKITEMQVKSALNELKKRGLPYKWDLNIYRGCSHGCKYCYGRKSHEYMNSENFEEEIFVKTNILEHLEKELSNKKWKKEIINIGGVCDSYQEIEKDYKLMPDILKLMIKYKNPIIISTKSDLILRDIDLINELSQFTYVNIPICITSCSDKVSAKVEPGASLPLKRFNVLKELKRTKAYNALHIMPILPFLADDEKSLEIIVGWAAEAEVSYMLTGVLYMIGGIRKRYLKFIETEFPEYYSSYLEIYEKGGASKEYKNKVHAFLAKMREKYKVNNSYAKFLPKMKG
jgi:DNA repair photolyase